MAAIMQFDLVNDPWYQFKSPVVEAGRSYIIRADPSRVDFTVEFGSPNDKKIEMTMRLDPDLDRTTCMRLIVADQTWDLPAEGIVKTEEILGPHLRLAVERALVDLQNAEIHLDPTGRRTEARSKAAEERQIAKGKAAEARSIAARKKSIEAALTE
jgi:hypothetical protein